MGEKITYPVLSRIRSDGEVYQPGEFISLSDGEATRLASLKAIGDHQETPDVINETEFDLKAVLAALIVEGHDIANLKMDEIGKLLGRNARGVKRADVDDALAEIEKEAAV